MNAVTAKPDFRVMPLPVADRVIGETCRAVEQLYGHRLRAMILTGSMARREETVVHQGDVSEVLGDSEFLLVFPRNSMVPTDEEVSEVARSVTESLRDGGIRCRVDLAAVSPSFLKRLPRHIFSYELQTKGRVVYGDEEVLRLIPEFKPEAIEREDAWRILSNRTVEWLEKLAEVPDGQEEPGLELFYSSVKLVLDAATSLLVFLSAYEPSYRARAKRLRTLAAGGQGPRTAAPLALDEFAALVAKATRWKCSPDLATSGIEGWKFCLAARECVCRLWSWELAQVAGLSPALPPVELVREWGRDLALGQRWRGWLRVAREVGWLRSLVHWPRWSALAREGTPRYWIYAIATECACRNAVFSPGQPPTVTYGVLVSKLRPFLPVEWPRGKASEDDWRALVHDLAWNYHHFVERTRA